MKNINAFLRLSFFCLALAGCTNSQKDSTSQAMDAAGNETSASYDKMRGYFDVGHKPKPVTVRAAQPRYCYKTYQDVICYAKPLPGEEYRLVGFQTQSGATGYTLPATAIGADDLPPLRSVEVGAPPAVRADGEKPLKEVIFDPAELQPHDLVPEKPQ